MGKGGPSPISVTLQGVFHIIVTHYYTNIAPRAPTKIQLAFSCEIKLASEKIILSADTATKCWGNVVNCTKYEIGEAHICDELINPKLYEHSWSIRST